MTLNKLVGQNDPDWVDMSDFVVHFTKQTGTNTPYDNSISILASGKIEARHKFGLGNKSDHAFESVCFSEVPLGQLSRLAKKRGSYGIGFRKDFVVSRKGGPIMYAYKDTTHAAALRVLLENAKYKSDDPIWHIAPFVDQPGQYPNGSYFFEWEREWRHPGHFKFDQKDPAFLILPEELHQAARDFFDHVKHEHLGPDYECPFIDPYWKKKKIFTALAVAEGSKS